MSDKKKPARKEPRPKAFELHEDQLEEVAGGSRSSDNVKFSNVVLKRGP